MKFMQQLSVISLLSVAALCAPAQSASYVTAAINDRHRPQDPELDARRHPRELVEFAQVKPGDVVVDLVPGSGYFTRIFSAIVGPRGHVVAIWPIEYARVDDDEVRAMQALAKDPHYSNVTLLMQPAAQLVVPMKADLVWICENLHDYPDRFMGSVQPAALARSILQSLKPHGLLVVVDHAAEYGSGLRDTERTHRIDPVLVKSQVESAGFSFDGESAVLHNTRDTHRLVVFDPRVRGYTDQFVFRFRVPD
jgi:predicted methyltransferase